MLNRVTTVIMSSIDWENEVEVLKQRADKIKNTNYVN